MAVRTRCKWNEIIFMLSRFHDFDRNWRNVSKTMKRRALWPHGNSIFPLTTYVARKNKVDASKKVEQAKAEKLNQSQGVEISAIVVLSFHFCFRLQQCGFHYWKGYKSSDSFWFRFCWAYERRFMTMLTTPIFVALLRLRLLLSLWLRLRLSLLFRLHRRLRFRLRLQLLLRFWLRLRLRFSLLLRLQLPLPGPDRKDWWVNLRKSLVQRGFVERHISGH